MRHARCERMVHYLLNRRGHPKEIVDEARVPYFGMHRELHLTLRDDVPLKPRLSWDYADLSKGPALGEDEVTRVSRVRA